ncbi:MAG TPA: thermopsin family protease [Thermoplasmata archaeon]|nr:thermopsin family protease [Thermoplasmata archaeon]
MSEGPSLRKSLWLLPIVLVVCSLMVLPGAAILPQGHASDGAASSGVAPAASASGYPAPALPSAPTRSTTASSDPFSPASQASAIDQESSGSSAVTGKSFGKALDQLASDSSLSSHSTLLNTLGNAISSGRAAPQSVYPPNLALLSNAPSSPGNAISPGYIAQPAPMGLGDFGLGASGAYEYNTTSFVGSLTLNQSNATFPSAYYFVTPPYDTNASYASPYRYGVQLNTVLTNVSIPGQDDGTIWTQNVFTWDGYVLQFEDNVWNFSSASGLLEPGTLYSGNGTYVAPDYYYDYSLPIYGLTAPLYISLYNNATVIDNRSTVTFGYSVTDSTATTYSAIYDTVVFNSPGANLPTPTPPPLTPEFQVNGHAMNAGGLLNDAELIFGGPGGGSNSVFSSLNGSMTLSYLTSGNTYTSIPSAYDFGADTGETSIGVTPYWRGTTEYFNAGPSMLYGLWGAVPYVSVAAGDIQYSGTISPSYAFLFVGNTVANLSYMPTVYTGGTTSSWDVYLPPAVPPSTVYVVQAYADGYNPGSASFSGNSVGNSYPQSANAKVLDAPLYIQDGGQYTAACSAISPAFCFGDLQLNVTGTFNHLNDWAYPSFILAWFNDTGFFEIDNLTQGPSSPSGTYYTMDVPVQGTTYGLLSGTLATTSSLPGYSAVIYVTNSGFFDLAQENYTGYNSAYMIAPPSTYHPLDLAGGGALLWDDGIFSVDYTNSTGGSFGTSIADSDAWDAEDVNAFGGSNAVDVYGINQYANIYGVNATGDYSYGVYGVFATDFDVQYVNATDDAYGVVLAPAGDTTVESLNVSDGAIGEYVTYGYAGAAPYPEFSFDDWAYYVNVTSGGIGVVSEFTDYYGGGADQVQDVSAVDAIAYESVADSYLYVVNVNVADAAGQTGVYVFGSYGTTFTNVGINGAQVGVSIQPYVYFGVVEYDAEYDTVANVWVNQSASEGILDNNSFGDEVYELHVGAAGTLGVLVNGSYGFLGLISTTTGPTSFDLVGCDDASLVQGSGAIGTGNVATRTYDTAVELYDFDGATLTDTTVTGFNSVGVFVTQSSTNVAISGVTATNASVGVIVSNDASMVTISDVSVTDLSIGAIIDEASLVSVSDVTASNQTLSNVWADEPYWGAPVAAVITAYTQSVTISDVTATTYPLAWFDQDSDGTSVSDVNSTGGYAGIMLNETDYALVQGLGTFHDVFGAIFQQSAYENTVTGSSFVDSSSYGVYLTDGAQYNNIYDNNFIGNNGATSTYNPAAIQAYTSGYNYFYLCTNPDCTTGLGNYWADWHTYGSNGLLAPYLVTGEVYDYFPIGPAETVAVTFTATGLVSGGSWSVTLNGVTQTSSASSIVFEAPFGAASYQVSASGYSASPSSGSFNVTGPYTVLVALTQTTYAVTLTAGGLSAGTSWSATVNGVSQSTTGPSLVFYLPTGSYSYSFGAVSGYSLSSGGTGTVTVGTSPVSVSASYAPNSSPSLASTSDLTNYFAVALAIAVIALVVGLVALLLSRKKGGSAGTSSAPPAAWTPPPSGSGGSGAGAGGAGGSGGAWSEGAPPPGSPPS